MKLDVVAGVDRFAAEGDPDTIIKLYNEWNERVDGMLSRSEGMFAASKSLGGELMATAAAMQKARSS